MKYISVFCGSSGGSTPIFVEQAKQLGSHIARRGYGLVYGGAHVGLMGAVAEAALAEGAKVIGVIPTFLKQKELEFKGLTKSYEVETMHERKAKMSELSHAVIALPGGFGTMEELFEMLTWAQLSLHKKPIALLNVNSYYDSLLEFVDKMVDTQFLREDYKKLLIVDSDIVSLLDKIEAYMPIENEKWFVTQ